MILKNKAKYSIALIRSVTFVVAALVLVYHVPAYAVGSVEEPQALIKNTTVKMFAKLKADKQALDKDPELIYGMVSSIVLPHFDFISMSKWVLGRNWRNASRAQKIAFIKAFRELLVRTYSVALLEYTDNKIRYKPFRGDLAQNDVAVKTQVETGSGGAVDINYQLHKGRRGWKVYDISVEGVSLIANYRTSFASEIKQKGLDALIARLQKHNKK